MERPFGRQDSVLEPQIYEKLANQRRESPFFSRFSSVFVQTRPLLSKTCELSSETRLLSLLFSLVFHLRRSTPTDERSPPLRHSFFAFGLAYARVTRTQPFFVFCLHTFTHPSNPLMHNELGVKVSPLFFLHPALHPPHRSPPHADRGRNEPKEGKDRARGEAFTHNTLCFKRLSANRREHA